MVISIDRGKKFDKTHHTFIIKQTNKQKNLSASWELKEIFSKGQGASTKKKKTTHKTTINIMLNGK